MSYSKIVVRGQNLQFQVICQKMAMFKQLNGQLLLEWKKGLTPHQIDLDVNFLRLQKVMVQKIQPKYPGGLPNSIDSSP